MIHALLHGKMADIGGRDPFDVEDLLTSVVLGTASYLDPHLALLPFLSEARTASGTQLPWPSIEKVWCEFWQNWDAIQPGAAPGAPGAYAAQPELIVHIVDREERRWMLLVEVKLRSGISSAATDAGAVSHQLAKYWVHLCAQAAHEGATPLGVIFVTEGISLPREEFEAANGELRRKQHREGDFYWLSWRRFERVVAPGESRQVADLLTLLRERWKLNWVDAAWSWPVGQTAPTFKQFFRESWAWPVAPRLDLSGGWLRG